MAMTDLTLTFLAERAQYITGASGAAIAVVEDGGVFCRARSGFTAPAVDVPLQTSSSSLTGECLRTGETLYCQSVETDERVDVESCRQLGIESILVLPLFQQHKIAGLLRSFPPNRQPSRSATSMHSSASARWRRRHWRARCAGTRRARSPLLPPSSRLKRRGASSATTSACPCRSISYARVCRKPSLDGRAT